MDRGHGDKLSRKMEAAIAALLTQPTVEAAARVADVSERALRKWMRLPEFKAAYAAARGEVLERTVVLLVGAGRQSVETLQLNLAAEKPSDQIRAACALLEYASRGVELLDLAERLAEVERRLAERGEP
jgi:hypothetical protein